MADVKHRTIMVNELRMHFAEQGEGPLVLLLHGFPETWYSWRHQLAFLAKEGFRAVAPDLRGYGGTDKPEAIDRYSIFDLVGDMVALLDAVEADEAVIMGSDWGATIAWHAALLRPDRFRGVGAIGVPMMSQPPVAPTTVFPQTEEALFYTLYFQAVGVAEKEFERDVRLALRKILFAASGDAGARQDNDGTPNPFSMVSRTSGLLAPLPDPAALPSWLTEADLDTYATAFMSGGFRGGLNFYRNLDRNRELLVGFKGLKVTQPALFLGGERDPGLSMPGMKQIIADMPQLVPHIRRTVMLAECGHWAAQERPEEVNDALLSFLRSV